MKFLIKLGLITMVFCNYLVVQLPGQGLEPYVINSAGNSESLDQLEISWSFGEAIISSSNHAGVAVQAGIINTLVVDELITGIKTVYPGLEIVAYPNPVKDLLWLELSSANRETILVELLDQFGRQIIFQEIRTGKNGHSIDFGSLAAGSYFLRVTGTQLAPKIFKVLKH